MKYPIVIHKDEDSVYGVTVPDFAGCFSCGENYDEALTNAVEAIELHLEGIVEDGEEIPKGTTVESHVNNEDFQGGIWALVDIDLTQFLGKAEKINITMPHMLICKIDRYVSEHKEHKSRSNYLANLARRDLGIQ